MRAIRVTRTGGPEVLELVDVPSPQPDAGQLLVDVSASGVNYIDTYFRSGLYPRDLPFGLGQEGAGTVRQVGPGVDDVRAGAVVAWKQGVTGSYADQVVVDRDEAVEVPVGVSPQQAAALMLQGLTAHFLATSTFPVQPGDWVGVHAAAGGVGLLLTQIVKLRGAHVVATVSTDAKAELAREAGADVVVGYDEFVEQSRAATGGRGVSAVYDGVGRATFDDSLAALRIRGTMVLFGAASGPVPPLDLQVLNRRGSLYVTRPTLAHYARNLAETTLRTDELFRWVAEGRLVVRIGHMYPLPAAGQAHEDLQARRTTGKLLLLT